MLPLLKSRPSSVSIAIDAGGSDLPSSCTRVGFSYHRALCCATTNLDHSYCVTAIGWWHGTSSNDGTTQVLSLNESINQQ